LSANGSVHVIPKDNTFQTASPRWGFLLSLLENTFQTMKKTILLVSIALISIATSAQLAIKYTPLVFLRNMKYTVHAEYMIPNSPRISVALGFSQNLIPKSSGLENMGGGTYFQQNLDNSNAGISLDPEVRMYTRKNMEGFYFGLYSSQRFSGSQLDEYTDYLMDPVDSTYYYANPTGGFQNLNTRVSIYGAQIGYQKFQGKNDRFVIDVYAGGGTKITSRKYTDGNSMLTGGFTNSVRNGVALRLNFSIGFLLSKGDESKSPQ
jgi:hypothetical protein